MNEARLRRELGKLTISVGGKRGRVGKTWTKKLPQSTINRIIDLVDEAQGRSHSEG